MSSSRAQGKRPAEPSQPAEAEAHQKARFDTDFFTSMEEYQRYKQKFAQMKVVPWRNINFSQLQHFDFEGLFARMGWLPLVTISEPIFSTLVRAFYSRVTYGHGGPIISTIRGVQIKLARRPYAAFQTSFQLDSGFMSARLGPLWRVSSLQRLFKGCAALQIPKGWANHRHVA